MARALFVLALACACACACAHGRVLHPGDPGYPRSYRFEGNIAATGELDVYVKGDRSVYGSERAGFGQTSTNPNALPGDVVAIAVNNGAPNTAASPRAVGLLASLKADDVTYVTSNDTGYWKCLSAAMNTPPSGWNAQKFDDSKWASPLQLQPNTNDLHLIPRPSPFDGLVHKLGIDTKAFWIWTNDAPQEPGAHPFLWCRFTVPHPNGQPFGGSAATQTPAPVPDARRSGSGSSGCGGSSGNGASSSHTTITPLPTPPGGGYAYQETTVTRIPMIPSVPSESREPRRVPGLPGMVEYPGNPDIPIPVRSEPRSGPRRRRP